VNLSEILPSLKKVERKKRFGTPPDRLTPPPPSPNLAPQVGEQLFGIRLPSFNFKFLF